MTQHCTPDPCFIVAWAFAVRPEHQSEFERAYGPNGGWVRLFRTGDGYIRTELHRVPDNPGRYITLDFWHSREQYDAFREQAKSAYQEMDARCEGLTSNEELIGNFADLASLHATFPQLGPETEIGRTCMVRAATPDDVPELMRLERAAPSAAHWSKESYEAIGRDQAPRRIALVAERPNRKLCGFVVARIVADECELENIVVEERETRHGIGSALVQELSRETRIRGVRRIFLEVRESNGPARGLYEKVGFQRDGERSSYYSDPTENAILYSLTL
jgi:[ribosomal protein S18]-alanine N-acetyltransferase